MIKVSAPAKVHLLGEHAVVYGKPAIITAVDLRITVTLTPSTKRAALRDLSKIIEPLIKKELSIKKIPNYRLEISSQIPTGAGLGSSAAVCAAYIAALLTYLKITWDLDLVNRLTYEAEKIFHGNPSGGDNSTIVYGGLIWFRKEDPDFKVIQPLNVSLPKKLSKNFVLINTGKPEESTKDMVVAVKNLYDKKPSLVKKFLEDQEKLVRELIPVIKNSDEHGLMRIIKEGEKNLEKIGVVSNYVKKIIREIERSGGAAKICGAGGKIKAAGVLLAYHSDKKMLEKIAAKNNLEWFRVELGIEGLKADKD